MTMKSQRRHDRPGDRVRAWTRRLGLTFVTLAFASLTACTEPTSTSPSTPAKPATPDAADPEPSGPALPDAAALLAASVDALGGADNLQKIRSYYAESTITMSAMGLRGVVKTWWRDGDFYTETDIPGVGLSRLGSVGGKVWGDDPINGLREIVGIEAEQAGWTSTLCLVYRWEKYFKSATTTGLVEEDGHELAEILLVSHLGDKVTLRIDTATKMPVSQTFSQANTLGAMPVKAIFSDFREVDGFKISFTQEVDAKLSKISATTTRFDANVEVDAAKFVMPGPAAAGTVSYADALKDEKKDAGKSEPSKSKGAPSPKKKD
ncbi:MAG: hypothetical protein R3B09_04110 [Nannocystaceae bacterium]